jgi:hypothetical protein
MRIRFASGGAAVPIGWKLLFGEASRADSPPRARESRGENEVVRKLEQSHDDPVWIFYQRHHET